MDGFLVGWRVLLLLLLLLDGQEKRNIHTGEQAGTDGEFEEGKKLFPTAPSGRFGESQRKRNSKARNIRVRGRTIRAEMAKGELTEEHELGAAKIPVGAGEGRESVAAPWPGGSRP